MVNAKYLIRPLLYIKNNPDMWEQSYFRWSPGHTHSHLPQCYVSNAMRLAGSPRTDMAITDFSIVADISWTKANYLFEINRTYSEIKTCVEDLVGFTINDTKTLEKIMNSNPRVTTAYYNESNLNGATPLITYSVKFDTESIANDVFREFTNQAEAEAFADGIRSVNTTGVIHLTETTVRTVTL